MEENKLLFRKYEFATHSLATQNLIEQACHTKPYHGNSLARQNLTE